MRRAREAILAVLLLSWPLAAEAAAPDTTNWVRDPKSDCAIFDSSARQGEQVQWDGACRNGRAEGGGTAIFLDQGKTFETISATFSQGVAQDGDVDVSWGDGWKYSGEMRQGRFDGEGIFVNAQNDRYEGVWSQGKLNGQGHVLRANGEAYGGAWKDDQPDGYGVLIHADGSKVEGAFLAGKFSSAVTAPPQDAKLQPVSASAGPLAGISNKKLLAVDGATLSLSPIEGGIERDLTAASGALKKTTFTFINERLGTVAADGGAGAGNVTGFFRLTDSGVEVRYADGSSEILATDAEGLTMRLLNPGAADSCRRFYPAGHNFSDAEKKLAVAEYASRLGLAAPEPVSSCSDTAATDKPAADRSATDRPAAATPNSEKRAEIRHNGKFAKANLGAPGKIAPLQTVIVKDSAVHTIDAGPVVITALESPGPLPAPPPVGPNAPKDASHCLKIESNGISWGFRNACGFDVQFAYCLAAGGTSLTACTAGGVPGSVSGNGFSTLVADRSFSETEADHNFRWLACGGGAGEVMARLDHADPPSGRCERSTDVALNKGDGR